MPTRTRTKKIAKVVKKVTRKKPQVKSKTKPQVKSKTKPKADPVPIGNKDYEKIRREVEKSTSERKAIRTRRGNDRIPRRYHLMGGKMDKLVEAAQKDGRFPNPYRKGGIYFGIIQALDNLGANTLHPFNEVREEIRRVLSKFKTKNRQNAWESFANREPRNQMSGKDVNGRILQNAMVLQRLTGFHPYGEKLRQLKACVDVKNDETGLPFLMLNTQFDDIRDVCPINDIRKPENRGRRKRNTNLHFGGDSPVDAVKPPETSAVSEESPENV